MDDTYIYKAGSRTCSVSLTRYEAHMLSRLRYKPKHETGVFAVHERRVIIELERPYVLAMAKQLESALENEWELLQFGYGIQEEIPGRRPVKSGGGGKTCHFQGQDALAQAGPGYCEIVVTESVDENGVELLEHRRVHDLRDMLPVVLDWGWIYENGGVVRIPGVVLRATRRRREIHLLDQLRRLVQFLEASRARKVECWLEDRDDQ